MDTHKFKIGQTVRFVSLPEPRIFDGAPDGDFQIIALLPEYEGKQQHRLDSTCDRHKRVVVEDETALSAGRDTIG